MKRQWRAPFAVDVPGVLSVHRRGRGDPAFVTEESGAIWRACRTPDGPGTLRVTCTTAAPRGAAQATQVDAQAWGPGAAWLLGALPGMLGEQDRPEDFVPDHPVLRAVLRRHAAIRIGRSGLVFEALVPAVLEQKVVGMEAARAWRTLLRRFGEPAPGPGPAGMRVPPPAAVWASIPSWEWHRAGVEAVRARTIAGAARVASRMEEISTMRPDEADRRLQALPGTGPWTSAEVRQRACGDADAVSVGDYHLPSIVGWALAGRVVDDAGMLELLAPYQGHRHRAALAASLSGARPPRRGPRMSVRDYRAF
ncbi:MAG TPA: DNA-3-methyladenine glycosylase 2 family protein [Streptosporangiaceae bacterium]|nr:DNA-3-methyladenine glycosylase 2 family protein [Streptosporangiaceae bacterium]